MRRYILTLLIALVGTGGIAFGQDLPSPESGSTMPVPRSAAPLDLVDEFHIAPGDVLEISVLEDQSLNRRSLVRPDGMISLPIAGAIMVAGRTPEEVQQIIVRRLSDDFVADPTVTVALGTLRADEDETASVFVVGQVSAPGRIEYLEDEPLTALQALAIAGGTGPFAATKRIQIRKRTIDGEELIVFNYNDVEKGLLLPDALILDDGDVIVVPERGIFE